MYEAGFWNLSLFKSKYVSNITILHELLQCISKHKTLFNQTNLFRDTSVCFNVSNTNSKQEKHTCNLCSTALFLSESCYECLRIIISKEDGSGWAPVSAAPPLAGGWRRLSLSSPGSASALLTINHHGDSLSNVQTVSDKRRAECRFKSMHVEKWRCINKILLRTLKTVS